jgi:hypothetical protein
MRANHIRPHRALSGPTPSQAYGARLKASPPTSRRRYFRVRQDKVDKTG